MEQQMEITNVKAFFNGRYIEVRISHTKEHFLEKVDGRGMKDNVDFYYDALMRLSKTIGDGKIGMTDDPNIWRDIMDYVETGEATQDEMVYMWISTIRVLLNAGRIADDEKNGIVFSPSGIFVPAFNVGEDRYIRRGDYLFVLDVASSLVGNVKNGKADFYPLDFAGPKDEGVLAHVVPFIGFEDRYSSSIEKLYINFKCWLYYRDGTEVGYYCPFNDKVRFNGVIELLEEEKRIAEQAEQAEQLRLQLEREAAEQERIAELAKAEEKRKKEAIKEKAKAKSKEASKKNIPPFPPNRKERGKQDSTLICNKKAQLEWLKKHVPAGAAFSLEDVTEAWSCQILTGPNARAILGAVAGRLTSNIGGTNEPEGGKKP